MLNQPREAQSIPEEQRYVFAYTVTVRNLGRFSVQLVGRYWLITNSNGQKTEVQGEGVVGEQPFIAPGEEFHYTSGAILETPMGTMEGYYLMVDHQNQSFNVDIPVFRLSLPTLIN
jgi:ApaG protein